MADEPRSFDPNTVSANRAQEQGLGVGQREMDLQQAPNREMHATAPDRTEPFDQSLDRTTNADRPSQADFSGQEPGDQERADAETRETAEPGRALDDRNAAGIGHAGDLGASTPANVDIHNLGQRDNPQEEWGEPAGEDATFSSNHIRRADRTEAERSQGAKTRAHNKDAVSRRI